MRLQPLSLLASFASLVLADVQFTSPTPSTTENGQSISVSWKEGTGTTPLSGLAGWQLFLVAGGSTDATTMIVDSTSGTHSPGATTGSATVTVKSINDGPPGQNAYYLRMISAAIKGGQVINYSQRFSINGMAGKWNPPSLEAEYDKAKGDPASVPPTADQTTSNQNNPAAVGAGGPQYSVSYQFQTTGLTKYAPMQIHAPTAITKQDTAPLFPASAFDPASEALPTASQLTTLTAAITYSYATRINTASPAPMPQNDMQKFLARWQD